MKFWIGLIWETLHFMYLYGHAQSVLVVLLVNWCVYPYESCICFDYIYWMLGFLQGERQWISTLCYSAGTIQEVFNLNCWWNIWWGLHLCLKPQGNVLVEWFLVQGRRRRMCSWGLLVPSDFLMMVVLFSFVLVMVLEGGGWIGPYLPMLGLSLLVMRIVVVGW